MRWYRPEFAACAALLLAAPSAAPAQTFPLSPRLESLVVRLAGMSAVTGFEDAMADSLLALLPGAVRDHAGNVVFSVGDSGDSVRVAICPMDEVGYVVGSITPEGYLTLRRVGSTNVGPLFDQSHEGQRVTVFGRRGPVPGVVGVRSTHLTRGRPSGDDAPFRLDDAYVDVGAASPGGVTTLGIDVLTPVTRAKAPHRYGERERLVAAPWAAQRAACAALLSVALMPQAPASGRSVFVFAARRHFNHDGASFALWELRGARDVRAVLLGNGETRQNVSFAEQIGGGPVTTSDSLLVGTSRQRVQLWSLKWLYPRTPVETVSLTGVAMLEDQLRLFLRRPQ